MKKYLQYNSVTFRETQSELLHRHTPAGPPNETRDSLALDLSGRPTINSVTKVTDQKGANEQEAALDLSRYGRQEAQEEALDLTKPTASRPDRPSSQSYQQTHSVNQLHGSLHTPPVTRHSKSPAAQPYSLLQAALNSSQPNAGLHTVFDRICQSTAAILEERAMNFPTAGMPMADFGRTIKPFSSLPSRPLGITRPQLSHPSGAVIQGMHKPIAITAPQPPNSSVNTKSQSVSDTTVSVTDANHCISSTCNQGYSVSQFSYSSGQHSQISRQLNSGKIGIADILRSSCDSIKDPNIVERYLIQPPKGLNHYVGNVNVIPTEALAGFSCNQCSKSFKTKAALKLHTTVHKTAEERQYECTICGRRFLHRHHLVVHQRKHSGEKPFKCTACSKTFMAIFLLHKHLRKHARETGPVAQISTEQLKQLHDNKIIPVKQTVPVVKASPVTTENNPVIVLDDDDDVNATVEIKVSEDEGKLDRKRYEWHKNQNILDIIEKDPNMILEKIKADLIKNSSENINKGQDNHVNEVKVQFTTDSKLDNECDVEKPVTKSDEITNQEKKRAAILESYEMLQEDNDMHIKSEDVDNTYNYIIKDNDEPKVNFEESEMKNYEFKEESNKSEMKMEETVTLFPEYGSDDEVELDFTTGELKVLGKKILDRTESVEKTNEIEIKDEKESSNLEKNKNDNEKIVEHVHSSDQKEDLKSVEAEIETKTDDIVMTENITDVKDLVMKEDPESNIEHEITEENDTKLKKEQETIIENSVQNHTVGEETDQKADKKKSDHEKGNIFEKISEMKDEVKISDDLNIKEKIQEDDADKVDKEVETILGIIKQKLCESEEELVIVAKKPKLVDSNESKADAVPNVRAKNNSYGTESIVFTSPKYSRHKKGKKKGKKVKCEICSRTFHSSHYLVLHMAVHKRNPMLQSLKKAKDYQMKAMGFLNKANVTCEICKKVFKFQKSLNSHMRVHSEKMIQTKLYRKAFRDFMAEAAPHSSRNFEKEKSQTQSSESESQVRRFSAGEQIIDRETASSVKRVSCDNETINMLRDDQYDEPPITVIIGEDSVKRYLCHACDNTYTTRQKLRMHALIHKDNCFLCDVCGKSFFRHVTLEKHISTHMLPRPHVCNVCKKSFIHRSSLMRHKVIHEKRTTPSIKQQVADLNFEMKMLDTYSMLRHERMQKMQIQKLLKAARTEPVTLKAGEKYDPLDLTVRIKSEDHGLPPVLSPVSASVPTSTQISPWNLSPPLITHETNSDLCEKIPEKISDTKSYENELKTGDFESVKPSDLRDSTKTRTESTCSESDTVAVEGHQVVKKRSRKTRVYQTSCRVCKEVFPNVMMLKSHMIVHNTVETHLYECHICQHRFTQSCSLLRHLKTSCQENRMKCVPCGKTFHRRNTFDQHMRLHQGGLPNLDGSFYDKRPDEAEVIEERESDIENNNLSKIEQAFINQDDNMTPLGEELVSLVEKETANNVTIIKQKDGNDSDSDARTYLYSEGEVHSRYNSDFSDNDWSPPQSPKKVAVPQDLSVTSGNMTLNLLSAVCSDIRNAEKEQELKRRELEEKQKELETIEILANLKRGAMQKSFNSDATVTSLHHVTTPAYIPINDKATNQLNTQTESFSASDVGNQQFKSKVSGQSNTVCSKHLTDLNKMNSLHSFETVRSCSNLHSEPKQSTSFSDGQTLNLPSVIEGTSPVGEPKIPTVVLEVAAEAERQRRQRVESMWQDRSFGTLSTGSPHSAGSGPQSAPVIPDSSAWNLHLALSVPHLSTSGPHSAPVVQHSSARSPVLAPFIPHSSAKSQHLSAKSPNLSAKGPHSSGKSPQSSAKSPHLSATSSYSSGGSSNSAPVGLHMHDRGSPSLSTTHSSGNDLGPTRETTLHHEMTQMKVHYPAIQERLSLLMKAQVTTASGSSQGTSAINQRSLDVISSNSTATSTRALQSVITPTVSSVQNTENDMPQDLSLKKTSQESTSTHNMPGTSSGHSRSFCTETSRSSHLENKQLEMLRAFQQEMLMTHEKRKSENLIPLPSEIPRQPLTESKTDIPRSESSRSLPLEVQRSTNNERKRSESVPVQPPLVPMHQCELCSRVLYNKTDLHLHMVEHGRSAGELYKLLHSNKALLEQKRHPTETPIDFTKAGPSNCFGSSTKDSKVSPPVSLDLSSKNLEKRTKAFNQSTLKTPDSLPGAQSKSLVLSDHRVTEKSSPISSSDLSDSLPSPSTPSGSGQSAANLDALRQELRLKIYARRRSQGLDDLKVEFKLPEPTEMTESEKLKLMYRRECNRQAAQRSRMRKKDLVDSLLEDLHKEEVVHSDLQRKMEALVAEKNFLLKVFKSHECVKGLVKPSENHSLFEALNHKEDVVDKEKSDEKRVDILVPTLNLEDQSDASGAFVEKSSLNKDAETIDCVEKCIQFSKETFITESQLGSSSSTQEDKSEEDLMEDQNDRFHNKSCVTEQGDDCSDTSDDTDSPILKLLTDSADNCRDKNGLESSLIKDNVDDT